MSMNIIPVIDVKSFHQSPTTEQKLSVAKSIRHACETYGFFRIINHDVPHDLINNITTESFRFFHLSSDEKLKFAARRWNPQSSNEYRGYFPAYVNGKEGLDISNPHMSLTHQLVQQNIPFHELNQWPTEQLLGKQWKITITQYWDATWRLAMSIMQAIALAFGLDENYFDQLIDDTMKGGAGTLSALRLNFYPLRDDSMPVLMGDDGQSLSCETHCDNVILTILYQHQVGGLQVQLDEPKRWLNVDVVPYTFVVNTGRCLERLTNGLLKAINHRVTLLDEERLSIPFFLGACHTTPIVALPTSISIENPPKYEPIEYGPYIMKAIQQFKEYRRNDSDKDVIYASSSIPSHCLVHLRQPSISQHVLRIEHSIDNEKLCKHKCSTDHLCSISTYNRRDHRYHLFRHSLSSHPVRTFADCREKVSLSHIEQKARVSIVHCNYDSLPWQRVIRSPSIIFQSYTLIGISYLPCQAHCKKYP
ncbi:unnamed protein product [Rotaria magnacalcarata]|uniref:Fe2OG dioxygenase domain-containing protein n=2 Tax=Rotaria magnacalcarata TaxID=392030 RepID=A0A8S2QS74_9BILA|nr:unnamed protein product [Rotaria magnacalcarata]CAF4129203.1 unnamed protein product [Rotaria magnacalcarata]